MSVSGSGSVSPAPSLPDALGVGVPGMQKKIKDEELKVLRGDIQARPPSPSARLCFVRWKRSLG
eukprot:1406128-Rhodomonas_salina.2